MMNRLTTDKPVQQMSNYQYVHNDCYVQNRLAMYRDGNVDITLDQFIFDICRKHNVALDVDPDDADAMAWTMYDMLSDEYGTLSSLISFLYAMMWSKANLRERLKQYEDTGLTPEGIKVLQDYHDIHTFDDVEASKYVLRLIEEDKKKNETETD